MREQEIQPDFDAPTQGGAHDAAPTGGAHAQEPEAAPTGGRTIQEDLEHAMRGWGADRRAILGRLQSATAQEKAEVRGNAQLMGRLRRELGERNFQTALSLLGATQGGQQQGGQQQGGQQPQGRTRSGAVSGQSAQIIAQRAQWDQTIMTSRDGEQVRDAFARYWNVQLSDNAQNSNWSVSLLRSTHEALKALPDQDTRAGVWRRLNLIDGGGGSWAAGQGQFNLGADAEGRRAQYGNRRVDWLAAVVRHEIGHAVDTALGGVRAFKQNVGGWNTAGTLNDTRSIDTWANQMGNGWTGRGGSPSSQERAQIKEHIKNFFAAFRGNIGASGRPLETGTQADHPIRRYLNAGVPVIDVAKACAAAGPQFYADSNARRVVNGKIYSINPYYGRLQSCNAAVGQTILRNYQLFSEAEFFAEVYTVFYEGYDPQSGGQPGRHVPVPEWRNWLLQNVHNRGGAPDRATERGQTNPSVGIHAGQDGAPS